jgi:hypothetical protein
MKKIINYTNKICLHGLGRCTLKVRGKLEKCVKRLHLTCIHNVSEYMGVNKIYYMDINLHGMQFLQGDINHLHGSEFFMRSQ